MPQEISIPIKALRDEAARELLRVWVTSDDTTHISIDLAHASDAAVWGIVLANLTRHIANVYKIEREADTKTTIQRIAEAFRAEVESPGET